MKCKQCGREGTDVRMVIRTADGGYLEQPNASMALSCAFVQKQEPICRRCLPPSSLSIVRNDASVDGAVTRTEKWLVAFLCLALTGCLVLGADLIWLNATKPSPQVIVCEKRP